MSISRPEHPKPQFERDTWLNLNGKWQFEFDNSNSAIERALYKDDISLSGEINVPFCPESSLSGIGHRDFIYGVVYKREFTITKEQAQGKTFIHFGAVDYKCTVYVNETYAGEHKGGYISFKFDISNLVKEGNNTITVFAQDNTKDRLIPCGKQSDRYESYGCFYTRTTGIWQTVWLEFTPENYIKSVKYYPDQENAKITIVADLCGNGVFGADITYEGMPMGSYTCNAHSGLLTFTVDLKEKHLWEVGHGRLYDVEFTFGKDKVKSYFGLRNVRLDGVKFLINEKSVFQRLVLDQGFYPDGIYTAPSDEALRHDIELSQAAGFNGARPHEKIFEERYFYHCDKLGYIVWGEYPDWGLDWTYEDSIYAILPEWLEELERDFNHPSIIGWCPHNETWDKNYRKQYDDSIRMVYRVTKQVDPTRPCVDTSGGIHVETEVYDVHDYNQDPVTFKENYDKLLEGTDFNYMFKGREWYTGGPIFVSEYGGIGWPSSSEGWAYGTTSSTDELIEKFKGLTDALLDNKNIFGLCYTQLTDVEQEQNGIYTYDRKEKIDVAPLKEILSRKAAIED